VALTHVATGTDTEIRKDEGMSASLIVLIPLVVFGIVTALCFVGCAQILGIQPWQDPNITSPYQAAIASESNIVAFWPLNDPPGAGDTIPTANDVATHPPPPLNGKYMDSVMLQQQPGIVPGDLQSDESRTPCAAFTAGRVEVPFHEELNGAPFTVECWVQPAWDASDTNVHAVVVTTDLNAFTGYALFCGDSNVWAGTIGLGQTAGFLQTTPAASSQPIMLGTGQTYYLALTFDGMDLNLFVSPVGQNFNMTPYAQASLKNQPPGTKFMESGGMLPLFIGMGRPDMPPGQLPFVGKIQDVAFYRTALGPTDLMKNFNLGSGLGS
jgi:Concanavalin A-like lectin/glucanases superfamily